MLTAWKVVNIFAHCKPQHYVTATTTFHAIITALRRRNYNSSNYIVDCLAAYVVAAYLRDELVANGITAQLNDLSSTVVLERPVEEDFVQRWQLACEVDIAHVVAMPNITKVFFLGGSSQPASHSSEPVCFPATPNNCLWLALLTAVCAVPPFSFANRKKLTPSCQNY